MAIARAAMQRETGQAISSRLASAVAAARMDELMHATATFGTRMAAPSVSTNNAGALQAPGGTNAWMAVPEQEDETMRGGTAAGEAAPAIASRPPLPVSTGVCTAFCAPSGEAAVLCIDIDPVEEKFLLTSDASGGVNVYDCSAALDHQDCTPFKRPMATPIAVPSLTTASSVSAVGHRGRKPVSVCKWYPHDNGLFITGGSDGRVVAWDANRLQPAFAWAMDGPVYCVDMSPIAHSHSLLAVATDDNKVRLVDLSTCGFTHSLLGHTGAVISAAWSPTGEYVVATGSMDGTIRVWDCRKSGATAQLAVLDQYAGGGGSRRTAPTVNPQASFLSQPVVSHAGGVNGLLFLPRTTRTTTTISRNTGSTSNNIFSTGFDRHARLWDVTTRRSADSETGTSSASATHADTESGGVASATGVYVPTTFPAVRPSTRRCVFACHTRLSHASNSHVVLYPCISTSVRQTNMTSIAGAGGLAGAAEACVGICDVETGEVVGELVGLHSAPINAVRVRIQSQQVFTAGNDGVVLVWESGLVITGRTREDAV